MRWLAQDINTIAEALLGLIIALIVAMISGTFLIPHNKEIIFDHIDDYVSQNLQVLPTLFT